MLLRVFKISGHSMMPIFSPGEKVLTSSLPYLFSSPKINDIIVFKYENKFIIKKIIKIESGKYYVAGENKNDSLEISAINKKEILGKVIFGLP